MSFKSNRKTEDVTDFSKNICMHIAATDPKSINIESLDKNPRRQRKINLY